MFIVFEGCDGCGKSTQCKILANQLSNAKLISFPDRQTEIGKVIDKYLKKQIKIENKEAVHLLFSANRWEKNIQIKELLEEDWDIICDRYIYSGQAYSLSNNLNEIWCTWSDLGLIRPDIIFYFQGQVEKKKDEIYETSSFQQQVAINFEKIMSRTKNVYYIKATNSIEEISKKIWKIYKSHLNK